MPIYTMKSKASWQALLEEVNQQSKMASALTDSKGGILQATGSRPPLCQAIRANKDGLTFICSQSNTVMLAEVRQQKQPLVDQCEAGFLRVVIPLLRDGELIGQVTACGLVSKLEDIDSYLVARQLGISEQQVQELLASSPLGDAAEIQALAQSWFEELDASEDRQRGVG